MLCDNTLLDGFGMLGSTCLQPEVVTEPWACLTGLSFIPKSKSLALTQALSKYLLVSLSPTMSWKRVGALYCHAWR